MGGRWSRARRWRGEAAAASGTWAQRGAGCFLDILPLTEGAPVERRRVRAAPAPFLPATPTAGAADGPLRPRGPPTVHWPDREGLGSGSGGSPPRWPQGARAGGHGGLAPGHRLGAGAVLGAGFQRVGAHAEPRPPTTTPQPLPPGVLSVWGAPRDFPFDAPPGALRSRHGSYCPRSPILSLPLSLLPKTQSLDPSPQPVSFPGTGHFPHLSKIRLCDLFPRPPQKATRRRHLHPAPPRPRSRPASAHHRR